jgi:hypothetical protein
MGHQGRRPRHLRHSLTPTGLDARPPAPRSPELQRPLWSPEGVDLSIVPPEVQQAITELIEPTYQEFVVGSADGLERSIGISLTHLLWLEILEQFDMKRQYTQVDAVLNLPGQRHESIAQHLRLIESKVRVGYFLVRIRELAEQAATRSRSAINSPHVLSPGRVVAVVDGSVGSSLTAEVERGNGSTIDNNSAISAGETTGGGPESAKSAAR